MATHMESSPGAAGSWSSRFSLQEPLSPEEDDELRRLHYLSQNGMLSDWSRSRIEELKPRDRRSTIRPPREFKPTTAKSQAPGQVPEGASAAATAEQRPRWKKFLGL
jgi:hypothetical protein